MRNWLREIRKLEGLTEAQAADAAGISQPAYHNIEMGKGVSVPTAKSIARALDFDWTQFYPDDEDAAETANG